MNIDTNLQTAIARLASHEGNEYRLSKILSVSHPTIARWILGTTTSMSQANAEKVFSLIEECGIMSHIELERYRMKPKNEQKETEGKMLKIDKTLQLAIVHLCEISNTYKVSQSLKVSHSTVSHWIDGTTVTIRQPTASHLLRQIADEKLLTPEELQAYSLHMRAPSTPRISEVEVTPHKGVVLPVISEAATAEVNPCVMPLLDCVTEYSGESIYFDEGKQGDYAIKVRGTSMMPWYPPGTVLLLRPYQSIPNGKRVIAVTTDGEVLFKIYVEKNGKIALFSIDDTGKDFVWDKTKAPLRYICRIVAIQRNEDAVDEAMRGSGIHHRWEDKEKKL